MIVIQEKVIPYILVADDEEPIRDMIQRALKKTGEMECTAVPNGDDALEILGTRHVDIVVTDIQMPGIDGIELNRIIQHNYAADVIIMTGRVDAYQYEGMIEQGASDFLQKPFQMKELLLRIKRVLRERAVLSERNQVEIELKNSLDKLKRTLEGIIQTMALTLEVRDPYTAGHQRRVAELAAAIARKMELPQDMIDQIHTAGVIHDLGKIAIPAEILSKPSRLTEFEFGIVRSHPQVAFDLLKNIEFPWPIARIVHQHHEKLDGSGYPKGLKGDEILLQANLLSIADVVEAIASHRPYRPSLGIDTALDEILRNRGGHYHPAGVDACVALIKEGYQL